MTLEIKNQNMAASLMMAFPAEVQYIGGLTENKKVYHYFKKVKPSLDNLICDLGFTCKKEGELTVYIGESDIVSMKISS